MMLHTHLCLPLPGVTDSPDPVHITPTMPSSPKDSSRGAHGVPFASLSSPEQPQEPAHPRGRAAPAKQHP